MTAPLSLFEATGVELEYMIVDRDTLRPRPIADKVLVDANGAVSDDIELGRVEASNELAAHVVEIKSPLPVTDLAQLEKDFQEAVSEINRRLAPHNAQLAPSGMHPFMDPATESAIWPHGNREIYETYDRIFNCHGHGWFNLQSCHINLPFASDDEFARLHYAIILLLPYLPALTASSPYMDGKYTGMLDARLKVYQANQQRVPQIVGDIIPEPVGTQADYHREILQKTYDAIAPLDPEKRLQHEWLNSRGAIARFQRNAIEIRVLDTQECPSMDLAIVNLITATLRRLVECGRPTLERLALAATPLQRKAEFMRVATQGPDAEVELQEVAEALALSGPATTAHNLWSRIFKNISQSKEIEYGAKRIQWLLDNGPLAARLVQTCGESPRQDTLAKTLGQLSTCLAKNRPFAPSAKPAPR